MQLLPEPKPFIRDDDPPSPALFLRRTRVYVAGPITSSGTMTLNIRRALHVGTTLLHRGFAPYIPHLTCFWEIVSPVEFTYADWMALDREFLGACDVMLRLDGFSKGAEEEEQVALNLGRPVYYSLDTLFACERPVRGL